MGAANETKREVKKQFKRLNLETGKVGATVRPMGHRRKIQFVNKRFNSLRINGDGPHLMQEFTISGA